MVGVDGGEAAAAGKEVEGEGSDDKEEENDDDFETTPFQLPFEVLLEWWGQKDLREAHRHFERRQSSNGLMDRRGGFQPGGLEVSTIEGSLEGAEEGGGGGRSRGRGAAAAWQLLRASDPGRGKRSARARALC